MVITWCEQKIIFLFIPYRCGRNHVRAGIFRNKREEKTTSYRDGSFCALRLNYYMMNCDRRSCPARVKYFELVIGLCASLRRISSSRMETQNYVIRYQLWNNENNGDLGTANKSLQTEGFHIRIDRTQRLDSSNIWSQHFVSDRKR